MDKDRWENRRRYLCRYTDTGVLGLLNTGDMPLMPVPNTEVLSGPLCKDLGSVYDFPGAALHIDMEKRCTVCKHRLHNFSGGDCRELTWEER